MPKFFQQSLPTSFIIVFLLGALILVLGITTTQAQTKDCDFSRDLSLGDNGQDVTCLQDHLKSRGYYGGESTGAFDTETRQAVIGWQRSRRISPDEGYFGPRSRAVYQRYTDNQTTPFQNVSSEVNINSGVNSGVNTETLQIQVRELMRQVIALLQELIANKREVADTGSDSADGSANSDGVIAAAEAANVDMEEFQSCLNSDSFQSDVQEDVNNAAEAGGTGTPYNVLALNDPLSDRTQTELKNVINSIGISQDGKRLALNGAIPFNAMTQIVDILLADSSQESEAGNSDDIAITPVDETDHIRGSIDAAVVVVEYSDFKCPFCADFHTTMKRIIDTYEADQVAWVYRQFPIPQLHPQAPRYAQASECVADIAGSDAFWSFADYAFAN